MRDRHAIAENNDHPEQETAEGWPAPPFYGKMRTSPNGQAWVIGWPYSRKPSRNCSVGRIRKRYEGGDKTFVTEVPNASFCFDGELMVPTSKGPILFVCEKPCTAASPA